MHIQPLHPISILLKVDGVEIECELLTLTDTELDVSCAVFFDRETSLSFQSDYFKGLGAVSSIKFTGRIFNYTITIRTIHFVPGFLVNTRI